MNSNVKRYLKVELAVDSLAEEKAALRFYKELSAMSVASWPGSSDGYIVVVAIFPAQ